MSLSTLPDLCLLTILDRIPLYDLLATVNRVCHRWASLRPIACHRRRHSLFLEQKEKIKKSFRSRRFFDDDDDIFRDIILEDGTPYYQPTVEHQIEYRTLVISNLSVQTCEQLSQLLPNITSLNIVQSVNDSCSWQTNITQINKLLNALSTKLVRLNLELYNKNKKSNNFSADVNEYEPKLIDSLFDQINQMSTLKNLTLGFGFPIQQSYALSTKLSILTQLEYFEYSEVKKYFQQFMIDNIEDALKNPNCPLKQISIKNIHYLDDLQKFSPRLSSKLVNYSLIYNARATETDLANRSFALSRLSSIEVFSIISVTGFTLSQITNLLSHLTKLTHLRLTPSNQIFEPTNDIPRQIPSIKALEIAPILVPQYPSTQSRENHSRLEALSLELAFPNVQVIKFLKHSQCTECGYDFRDYHPIDVPMVKECIRRTLKPLKKCNALRKIYFNKNRRNFPDIVFTPDQL